MNRTRVERETAARLQELARRGPEHGDLSAFHDALLDVTIAATAELVDVTRAAFGKVTLSRQLVDLRELAEGAADGASAGFAARAQSVAVLVGSAPIWISVDPGRMRQVITNLLDNAAAYTPRGGRIVVCVEATQNEAIVRVRDNGAGIPPEALERIFEPFEREPAVDDPGSAASSLLGLGLTVVRSLVRLHGGSVTARSRGLGLGAELVVSLPLLPPTGQWPAGERTSA